jgi:riboflavin kinase / FMN adenylyltransferase
MATLSLDWAEHPPPAFTGGAVTVGNFDGVHLGHRALVEATRWWVDRVGGPSVVVTFDPPPFQVLHPSAGPARPPLTTLAGRAETLHAIGADHVIILKATPALLALSPEAFFEDILIRQLGAKAVIEGYDFRFGRGRAGDVEALRALCKAASVGFEEVQPVLVSDEAVSSSRVRAALMAGNVAHAAELLGRPYRISGTVIEGAKRGRTIGFPTANLGQIESVLPTEGVYAVRAIVNGKAWPAAANIGPNPTFGEDARKIEIHLLDFHADIYGQQLVIEFVARLRETKPFAGVPALVEQLQKDIAAARLALVK